jgi:hypothetical protein
MRFPRFEQLNSERFLDEAFEAKHHDRWERDALLRRNIYLWFFLTGIACIFITAFTHQFMMSILSLFLATLSLVVMTKYDTQLYFLRILKLRDEKKKQDQPSQSP